MNAVRAAYRRIGAVAVLAAVLATAAACGGDSGSGDAAGAVAAGDDSSTSLQPLTVTVAIEGEAAVSGSTIAPFATNSGIDYESCGQYAKGGEHDGTTYYVIPMYLKDKIEGKTVFVGAMVKGYAGPGTYGRDKIVDQAGTPGVSVDGQLFSEQRTSTEQIVTDDKGGGEYTFAKLAIRDSSGKLSPGISGKISWTCSDK